MSLHPKYPFPRRSPPQISKSMCPNFRHLFKWFQEQRLLIILDQPDELKHYIERPHIFAFSSYFCRSVSDDYVVRLGLSGPNVDTFKHVSCIFSGYHAMRSEVNARRQFFLTFAIRTLPASRSDAHGVFLPKRLPLRQGNFLWIAGRSHSHSF